MLSFIKHHIHIFDILSSFITKINFIIPNNFKVIVSKLMDGTKVGNFLGDGQHVYNLNCHESTSTDYYKFGHLFDHEKMIHMFYVDPLDAVVNNYGFKNYFDLNINVLVSHLRKLHDCSDSYHKLIHCNYVC